MTAIVNGIQYIGGQTSPDEFIKNQAGTIDGTQTVENGVLAGPITIPGTITVTGSNSMCKIEVDTIDKQSGSTVNSGGPGTYCFRNIRQSVTLGCGATQTGFGRTGTVDWCTTAKTFTFTVLQATDILLIHQVELITVTSTSVHHQLEILLHLKIM